MRNVVMDLSSPETVVANAKMIAFARCPSRGSPAALEHRACHDGRASGMAVLPHVPAGLCKGCAGNVAQAMPSTRGAVAPNLSARACAVARCDAAPPRRLAARRETPPRFRRDRGASRVRVFGRRASNRPASSGEGRREWPTPTRVARGLPRATSAPLRSSRRSELPPLPRSSCSTRLDRPEPAPMRAPSQARSPPGVAPPRAPRRPAPLRACVRRRETHQAFGTAGATGAPSTTRPTGTAGAAWGRWSRPRRRARTPRTFSGGECRPRSESSRRSRSVFSPTVS